MEHFLMAGVKRILYHIKEGGQNLPVIIDICRRYSVTNDVVFGLQSVDDVEAVKKLCPELKILAFMPGPDYIEKFAAAGADYIRLWEDWLSESNISRVKAVNKELWIMTGAFVCPGYTDFENLVKWKSIGADAVLINEVEKVSGLK